MHCSDKEVDFTVKKWMSQRILEELVPVVQGLGRRHVKYGVKDGDYGTVASALLWTLEEGLGAAFTPPVKAAWVKAYTVLADTMKAAAAAEAA